MSAIRCVGVVHVYRVAGTDVAALRGVDLDVASGERVALLGPSGSGKSTLLTVLAGLRSPSAGRVLVDGTDISRIGGRALHRYRAGLGLMLQGASANLLPWATPAENVRHARRGGRRERGRGPEGGGLGDGGGLGGGDGGDGPDVASTALGLAGLDRERRPVAALGRAERQAVALAVAMSGSPRLLLCDEPTSQLDDGARVRLLDLLDRLAEAAGSTVVMVTHDEEVAARMQRMVRMRDGRVGSEGVRDRQLAVVGADGSVQLPEPLLARWPPGARVEITAAGPDLLHLTRAEEDDR